MRLCACFGRLCWRNDGQGRFDRSGRKGRNGRHGHNQPGWILGRHCRARRLRRKWRNCHRWGFRWRCQHPKRRNETGTSAQLTLGGDDDPWVFVNKQRALDLGGLHVSSQGTLVLDDAAAQKPGLPSGSVYEIAIFHAERQSKSSILTLMLAGFNTNPSVCRRH